MIRDTKNKALSLFLCSICGSVLIFSGLFVYFQPRLPSIETLKEIKLQTPLLIYSNDGKLIGEFGEKRRTPILYEEIPPSFIHAILAAEDSRFMQHFGIDPIGLSRAVMQLIQTGQMQTGGSTITMQVARNYFLSREKTFTRKFNEILLSIQIEQQLTKQEILELYVNKIYLGHRSYGIEAAAQVYYGKPIQDLSIAQLAMIAGLPKAPSSYNPISNPSRALIRRNWILNRMRNLGYIDHKTFEQAIKTPVTARYHGPQTELQAPHVAEMIRKEMIRRYGLSAYTDGYQVYSTLNSKYQQAANQAVLDGLESYHRRHGYDNSGVETLVDTLPDHSTLIQRLRKKPQLDGLEAAVVLSTLPQSAQCLIRSGDEVDLAWDGLKWARPYISANRRGPAPSSASDILKPGDLIYIRQQADGHWQLSQKTRAQAALISMNPNTGSIEALVGGTNYQQSHFNRVTQATRQPGSNFKPFIYTAALSNGFTAASLLNDAPIVFEDNNLEDSWRPQNSSGKFGGPTRLRKALYQSKNLISIRLLKTLTPKVAINYVQRFGFDNKALPNDLSLALGSAALTPLDIATGYSVFANGGYKVSPYIMSEIRNRENETIYRSTPKIVCTGCSIPPDTIPTEGAREEGVEKSETKTESTQPQPDAPELAARVVDERTAFIINSMLRDVILRGTGTKAKVLNRGDLAGKTGTTNDQFDAWFSGFNGNLVTTVWVGFDQPQTLGAREYGSKAALPIWIDFMRTALQNQPEIMMKQPDGMVVVRIDPTTGERATASQEDAILEIFKIENAPKESSSEASTRQKKETNSGSDTIKQLF
ncbi:MAG: penicillin-binding protein 1A [Pseudomonadales bacterium]|nr:penicillin-binding protein 1A [Pseudomonadales bacterium]